MVIEIDPIALVGTNWCVKCLCDKDKKEMAFVIYKGYSLCETCFRIVAKDYKSWVGCHFGLNIKKEKK